MRPAPLPRVSLLGLALVASACASDPARRALRDVDALEAPAADPPRDAPDPYAFSAPGSQPRLRHTITLGESHGEGSLRPPRDAAAAMPVAPAPAAPAQPIYVVPTYGYGYGYGPYGEPVYYGPGTFGWHDVDVRPREPAKPSPSRPPALGQDWAKPPSYGPAFPFKTAPADPWK